ncbi:MAG: monooxygenase, partial [Polyangiales bacterium]
FLLDHDEIDHTRYITGFDFQPGLRSMVHHVIVYAVKEDAAKDLANKSGKDGRPGWDCYGEGGGELASSSEYIGGWQPGVMSRVLPEGIGRALPAKTRIMIQIHYDTGHGIGPDRSAIDMMLEERVERVEKSIPVGSVLWFAGDGMKIPANAPDTMVWAAYDPSELVTMGKSVEIHNVMLHMHELGSIGRVAVLRENGETECLLNIPRWDFHWMADYYFDTPVHIAPGDKLYVECHWDNSAANQKIVNGVRQTPRDLHWGTDDEMCGAVLTYSEVLK